MTKLRTIAATALIAFPLGVFAAEPFLKGHPNMVKARQALDQADHWITESQKANERVWGDEGGHGKRAHELIGQAKHELDLAAEWVNSHQK
jgi:hypothetical protein